MTASGCRRGSSRRTTSRRWQSPPPDRRADHRAGTHCSAGSGRDGTRLELRSIHRLQRRLGLARARVRMIAEQRAAEVPVREKLRRAPSAGARSADRCCFRIATLVGRQSSGSSPRRRRSSMSCGAYSESPRDDDRRVVLRRRRRQRPAHAEYLAGGSPAVPRLRALLNEVGGKRRQTGEIHSIARVSRQHRQRER